VLGHWLGRLATREDMTRGVAPICPPLHASWPGATTVDAAPGEHRPRDQLSGVEHPPVRGSRSG
jgi:hypothetical protein